MLQDFECTFKLKKYDYPFLYNNCLFFLQGCTVIFKLPYIVQNQHLQNLYVCCILLIMFQKQTIIKTII